MWTYRADIDAVHDGDTVTAILDVGFCHTARLRLRLSNVWAPELATPGGTETREFVRGWLNANRNGTEWPFIVRTIRLRGDTSEVTTFGRYVATVETPAGESLNGNVNAYLSQYPQWGGGTGTKEK